MLRTNSQSEQHSTLEVFYGRVADDPERDFQADAPEWYVGAPQVNEAANPTPQNTGDAHPV